MYIYFNVSKIPVTRKKVPSIQNRIFDDMCRINVFQSFCCSQPGRNAAEWISDGIINANKFPVTNIL